MSRGRCGTRRSRRRRHTAGLMVAVLALAHAAAPANEDALDFLLAAPPADEPARPAPTPEPAPAPETLPSADAAPLATIPLAATPAEPTPTPRPAPSGPRLEEIVVTAQKKAQFVEDVPISLSVVDHKFIASWGITDVREAMLFVPNVKVEEAGFFASPRVRGFSFNNNNKAFEPPAGIALDGIPYTRVEYFNAALFDVQRIEALRGPQGTTFGKNTTAGLIHVVTQNPTDDFTGYADVQRGELDRLRIEAAVGGPLIAGMLNFRIAGLYDERDGFIRNTTAPLVPGLPSDLRSQGRRGVRAKLDFIDLAGATLRLSLETVELESGGAGAEMYNASERIQAVLRRYDPNADFERNNYTASIDQPDGRIAQIDTINAEFGTGLGDWNLVALAGHSVLKNELQVDTDFSPAPAIYGEDRDRSPTTSFELRAESPEFDGLFGLPTLFGTDLGSSNLLVGLYHQHREIQGGGFEFRIGTLPFLELTLAGTQDAPAETLLAALPPQLFGLLFAAIPASPPGGDNLYEEVKQGFEQQADASALFGQFEWSFAPRWTAQLGLRYSVEDKSARWNSVYTSPGPSVLLPLAGISQFSAERSQSEEQLQPKLSLNWQPTDDVSLFLHWARAYKGGGFNAFAFRDRDDELVFQPEVATEWGFDFKGSLLDGRAKLNVSLYRLDIDDFQVLTRIPDALTVGLGVTKVENAAKARSQGVEADFTWLVTEWLTLIGTAAFNDTEYLDFKTNDCPADQDNTDGDDDQRCDATGKGFAFAPRQSYTLFANLSFPIGDGGLRWGFGGGAEYQSLQYLDIDLDPRKTQEGFFRYRANIGISNPMQGWSFRVFGENLGDARTSIRQGDVVPGLFVNIQEAPRQFYAQLRYEF
ncbi:MAG: TonB-dependent receptor [Sinimarinibacterium flocculans]|uniref:TonB-dependent receptor n=1 Tax=Sinimarinibacterium flocculans TaxID=985250 RepID=UPI003C6AD1B3